MAIGVVGGLFVPAPAAMAPQAVAAPLSPGAEARATGHRVVAATTPTTEVFAEPNGTVTLERYTEPVRVRQGDRWSPVDTNLHTTPAGVVPRATAVPVRFSPGGTGPFATFGGIALTWPTALPAPVLAGDTATYPDVAPDTDLRVRATTSGFSHSLIVKSRTAVGPIRIGLRTDGVTVKVDHGALTAVDAHGRVVSQTPVPVMTDARGRSVALPVEVTKDTLVLTPDQQVLDDPATTYPVDIDPDWHSGDVSWTLAYTSPDALTGQNYWGGDSDKIAKVGYTDRGDGQYPSVTARSFFQFGLDGLAGKQILSAEFDVLGKFSASCGGRFWADQTWPIGHDTTGRHQPGAIRGLGERTDGFGRTACDPAGKWVGWGDLPTRDAIVDALANNIPATFRLTADEGNHDAWRKFDPNARLVVNYNSVPNTPTNLSTQPRGCDGEQYLNTTTPTLTAVPHDDDSGDNDSVDYEWFDRATGARLGGTTVDSQASDVDSRIVIPAGQLRDGSKVRWHARARDWFAESEWTEDCLFTVDQTAPDKAPTVTSTFYPEHGEGGSPGQTGPFTFNANGVADTAEFVYRLSGGEEHRVPAVNGIATAGVTPPTADPYTLTVSTVDRAGNRGPAKAYDFRVGLPKPPVGYWPLDGSWPATALTDASGRNHPGTIPADKVSWTDGRVGDALQFTGRPGSSAVMSNGPVVDTSNSFTVSAWVRLDAIPSGGRNGAAVSQDGANLYGFHLGYVVNLDRWTFTMAGADDVTTDQWAQAVSATAPTIGAWTHLTATYNVSDSKLSLYVNGVLSGTAAGVTPWKSTGALRIGQSNTAGATDFWPGAVDEVRVYDRVLPDVRTDQPSEVDKLAGQPAVDEAIFAMDEGAGAQTVDVSGNYVIGKVTGAPKWQPGIVGPGALQFDRDFVSAGKPLVRTDNSFTVSAWVSLDRLDASAQTIVSQENTNGSAGFWLQYRGDQRKWTFVMSSSDTATPPAIGASAPTSVQTGEWTHVTGVYDATVPEIRLYVNGAQAGASVPVPGGVKYNAAGPLVIGRGKWNNTLADYTHGWIDEVHVSTGARTGDEIRGEFLNPAGDRTPGNVVKRYYAHNADHFTTNGVAPRGAKMEFPMGTLAPAGTAGAYPLYQCQLSGWDEFTSRDPNCEGQPRLGTLGLVYDVPPAGRSTALLYRCRIENNGEHFDDVDPKCAGYVVEGPLGYLTTS